MHRDIDGRDADREMGDSHTCVAKDALDAGMRPCF